jgi:hypothetical protein
MPAPLPTALRLARGWFFGVLKSLFKFGRGSRVVDGCRSSTIRGDDGSGMMAAKPASVASWRRPAVVEIEPILRSEQEIILRRSLVRGAGLWAAAQACLAVAAGPGLAAVHRATPAVC